MAAAAAGSLASMGYAAAQGAPQLPSGAAASREVAQAQANALPFQRTMAAAEQTGGETSALGYYATSYNALMKAGKTAAAASIPADQRGADGNNKVYMTTPSNPSSGAPQAETWTPASAATANFTGFGTADIEGELAAKEADIQTQLQQRYGPAFASLALANAEQSDPAGFAARAKELGMVQEQMQNPMPINPLATTLDQRIKARLDAGSGLDDMSRELLDQALAKANAARGGSTDPNAVATEMSTGNEGQQRLQAAESAAGSWLSSGATPADVQYKREQQSLANLGSFVAGQTPESQFRNLSGAEQGAAPFYPGNQQPSMPGGAGTIAPAYTVGAWQTQLRGRQGQANGWLGGLSSLLSATSALGKSAGPGGGG